jgi:predicted dehydrogenase
LEFDAISVCVPNFLHIDLTINILNSGAHAFVDIPLAFLNAVSRVINDAPFI